MAASILLCGCGATGSTGPSATTKTATTVATAITAQTSTSTTSTSTATPPATVPTHAVTTSSSNVRLPATFTIEPNGALTPATISAPAGVTVDLTVVSRSSRAHRVVIEASPRRALTVPAAGRASVTIEGLKNGRYPVDLDGVARGALTMGAAPGP